MTSQERPLSKYRNFSFSHTTKIEDATLEDTLQCRYMIYTKEVTDKTEWLIQGVVVFSFQKPLEVVMKMMPGYCVGVVTDVQASIDACKNRSAFKERGMAPLTQSQKGLKRARDWNLRKSMEIEPPAFTEGSGPVSMEHSSLLTNTPAEDVEILSKPFLCTVCVAVIPPLGFEGNFQYMEKKWKAYALWILSVLNIPSFTVTQYNTKHLTLILPGDTKASYDFCFSSTWLKSKGEELYYNYKLSESSVKGCGLSPVAYNEFSQDSHITTFDLGCDLSCVMFQADCGMGKTQFGLQSLITKHKAQGLSILLPTENISLSFFFKQIFPEFSHYKLDKDSEAFNSSLLICQFESLHKLKRLYDVIIIDECTSFFLHTASPTMEAHLEHSLCVLGNHLRNSLYVYGTDADLSPQVVSLLSEWRAEDPPYLLHYTHKPLSNNNMYLSLTKKELLCSLTLSL